MNKEKITLTGETETLLVPLYCRYLESMKPEPIIKDDKAVEIVDSIDYGFDRLAIPKQTYVTVCMRAKQFDDYTESRLADVPDGIVIHLGCGLDSRFDRIDNNRVEWYDLDVPEVIALRKHFYLETGRYHFISSSAVEPGWIEKINAKNKPVLVLAEGLFMYLKEEDIKSLFIRLQNKFSKTTIIFDSYSELAAKGIGGHPSIKKTSAVVSWGISDAKRIESWGGDIHLAEEWYFTQSEEIRKLDAGYRFVFRIMGMFPAAKKAHRILVFQLGGK
ncbi:MAG: class I SAM-dependent methyltransferase [Spirochaetales bacterium]|nr:class I SAM-dependent methyltransferase [Spirochaetales bacterium]